ncbi:MAG TPA: [FeFe] hydrogenase H-cluster radical SAM maturase HydG [Bacteroidales bacterium]|nr:[FeFe] hydrogenase H-cluster radical SAM maturase HydG [Bacteroidales bacterium]
MKFYPQQYQLPDRSMQPFIDEEEITRFLDEAKPTRESVKEIIEKSLNKNRLSLQETAVLLNTTDPEMIEWIKAGARSLKEKVYGKRIVLFAPLYVGNYCSNNCCYCGFKASNTTAIRKTLTKDELIANVKALEEHGQKRLILVFGEHRTYTADFIADTVRDVYQVKKDHGEIRRVNINAAPFDIEGFKTVHESGIGTYQIFQETYHKPTYAVCHPSGKKADYDYRLTALDRAMEAGIDDVGIGALFGLYDWRFEVLALLRHVNHLEACYNVGPHTISFPRIQDALEYDLDDSYQVKDEEFTRLVAILRLAVPYTGLILTAREPEHIRREVLAFGCSQIDAGTKLEIGAYAEHPEVDQNLSKEQFKINDDRTLNAVIDELIESDYIPSFCTACYRKGRTGQHFMEFSVPGFIKKFCTPNALLTLAEYIIDYASESTAAKGWALIERSIAEMEEDGYKEKVRDRIERIKNGERDLYF